MAATTRHRPPANKHLLDVVAPASWERPVAPPHAHLDDPLAALKESLRVTLARDMAKVGVPDERIPYLQRGVLGAVKIALDAEHVSLSDQTAVCLIALRVAFATVLALGISDEELGEEAPLETHLQD